MHVGKSVSAWGKGRKVSIFLLSIALLVAVTGCRQKASGGESSVLPDPAPSLPPASGAAVSTALTGTYKGQTITMDFLLQTDLKLVHTFNAAYHQGYAPVRISEDDVGYCYIDDKGRRLGNTMYAIAFPFDASGRARVQNADLQYRYIDLTGREVASAPEPEPIQSSPPLVDSYTEMVNGMLNIGFKDLEGNKVTDPIFQGVNGMTELVNFAILQDGCEIDGHKQVLLNRTAEIVALLPNDCKSAKYVGDGVIACAFIGKTGSWRTTSVYRLCDETGRLLNEETFSAIGEFVDGLAPVTQNGKIGLIDEGGQFIIPPGLPFDDDEISLELSEGKIVGSLNGNLVVLYVNRT